MRRSFLKACGLSMAVACSPGAMISQAPPHRPIPRPVVQLSPTNEEQFWRTIPLTLSPGLPHAELPLRAADLGDPNVSPIWASLSEAERSQLTENGFLLRPFPKVVHSIGANYLQLADTKKPLFISAEALFELVHIALRATLAESEERLARPSLLAAADRLLPELQNESLSASSDLKRAYRIATDHLRMLKSLVASDGVGLSAATRDELGPITREFGPRLSPVLGVTVDYAPFAPNGDCERAFACRFHAWGELPFLLAARQEELLDRSILRDHSRASLLLTRLLAPAPQTTSSLMESRVAHFSLVERVETFLSGPPDSVSLSQLAQLSKGLGLDPKTPRTLVDVVRLAQLAKAILARASPRVLDPNSALLKRGSRVDPGDTRTTRLLGGRYARDSDALQRFGLFVRGLPSTEDVKRERSPRASDVLAWMGSPEAVAARERDFGEAKAAYGSLIERLRPLAPPLDAPARHESVYASLLDLVESAHRSSVADESLAATTTVAWQKHAMEATAGIWTTVRHDFAAVGVATSEPYAPSAENSAAHTPIYVVPHPEVIARMVAIVDQLTRGLASFGVIRETSSALPIVREVDRLLRAALESAVRAANDEAESPGLALELARFPHALLALERATHSSPERVTISFRDFARKRNVLSATGVPEEIVVIFRKPKTMELVVASGVALPTHEWEEPLDHPVSDAEWRKRTPDQIPPRLRDR